MGKDNTMKYMLLIYGQEDGWQNIPKAEVDQMMAAYGAYTEAITKSGVCVGSNRLQRTSAATTVRSANGKTSVLNSPYSEAKERLGGCSMFAVAGRDAALAWAARGRGASYGAVEVRPIWEMWPGRSKRSGCSGRTTSTRVMPPRRWRATATASWLPFSRRG